MPMRLCSLCLTPRYVVAASRDDMVCHPCRRALATEAKALRRDVVLIRAQVRAAMRADARAERELARQGQPRQCGGCGEAFVPRSLRPRFCGSMCSAKVIGGKAHRFDKRSGHSTKYGTAHQAERRLRVAAHNPTDACARCGLTLGPMGPHLHLDHDEQGGYLGFSHAGCNRRAGAVKGRAMQRSE